jgi:hypothetical protein
VNVVLVHHRDVIEHVLLVLEHAPHSVLQDHFGIIRQERPTL